MMKQLVYHTEEEAKTERKKVKEICQRLLGVAPGYNDRRAGGRRCYTWYTWPGTSVTEWGMGPGEARAATMLRLSAALQRAGYRHFTITAIRWHSTGIRVTTGVRYNRYALCKTPLSSKVHGLVMSGAPEGIIADALEEDGWPTELYAPLRLRATQRKSLAKDLRELCQEVEL